MKEERQSETKEISKIMVEFFRRERDKGSFIVFKTDFTQVGYTQEQLEHKLIPR